MSDLSYEDIADGLVVCKSALHRFGTDAVLLAEFSGYRRKDRVCDLGTGCGISPMLMQRTDAPAEIYGVDIQPEAIAQMQQGIARSTQIHSALHPVCADLKTLWEGAPLGQLDLVTCNPPYKAAGAGIVSRGKADRVARHETECALGDVFTAAAKLLRFSGRLCICQRPERLADIFVSMREAGIEPKRFREVIQREGGKAWLVLVEGRLGGKSGIETMPPLYIEKGGILSPEMIDIYGEYKEGHGEGV